jgi:hypothetical protein
MMPRINMRIRLGPMVNFEIQGESCTEIATALEGFERLNQTIDCMFSDLAQRVYPEAERDSGEKTPEGAA